MFTVGWKLPPAAVRASWGAHPIEEGSVRPGVTVAWGARPLGDEFRLTLRTPLWRWRGQPLSDRDRLRTLRPRHQAGRSGRSTPSPARLCRSATCGCVRRPRLQPGSPRSVLTPTEISKRRKSPVIEDDAHDYLHTVQSQQRRQPKRDAFSRPRSAASCAPGGRKSAQTQRLLPGRPLGRRSCACAAPPTCACRPLYACAPRKAARCSLLPLTWKAAAGLALLRWPTPVSPVPPASVRAVEGKANRKAESWRRASLRAAGGSLSSVALWFQWDLAGHPPCCGKPSALLGLCISMLISPGNAQKHPR